ncbi:MAG: glycine cleavage system protein GcvH [bacterium]|nr:glycine cleavage system protein GcvH [bacterium]
MHVPEELWYTKEHEWVRFEGGGRARMGITDHAQHELGDITYVDLPGVGKQVTQGAELMVIESVKAASDVYAPVSGTVGEVNTALADAPELINKDPYGGGWLCVLSGVDEGEKARLLSAAEYRALLERQ